MLRLSGEISPNLVTLKSIDYFPEEWREKKDSRLVGSKGCWLKKKTSLTKLHPKNRRTKTKQELGQWFGSVGRAVASKTRGPQCKSSHWQKITNTLNICLMSTVYWKDKRKEKAAGNGPFFKKNELWICFINWVNPGLFLFIFSLFKQTKQFLQQINVKNVMSIQFTVTGFEPTTSQTLIVSHNH